MADRKRPGGLVTRIVAELRGRVVLMRKAASFALVGLVNTGVDAVVFFLAYAAFTRTAASAALFESAAVACRCGGAADIALVAANVTSWTVGVTCSYVLNSTFTFRQESGGRLGLRRYAAFAASGVLGLVAATTTLVVVAQWLPVWAAKAIAILVSFVVNFSMSHFVVFRPRRNPPARP